MARASLLRREAGFRRLTGDGDKRSLRKVGARARFPSEGSHATPAPPARKLWSGAGVDPLGAAADRQGNTGKIRVRITAKRATPLPPRGHINLDGVTNRPVRSLKAGSPVRATHAQKYAKPLLPLRSARVGRGGSRTSCD